jgi:hypothetical protein
MLVIFKEDKDVCVKQSWRFVWENESFYASFIVCFLWVAAGREGQQKMSLFTIHSV